MSRMEERRWVTQRRWPRLLPPHCLGHTVSRFSNQTSYSLPLQRETEGAQSKLTNSEGRVSHRPPPHNYPPIGWGPWGLATQEDPTGQEVGSSRGLHTAAEGKGDGKGDGKGGWAWGGLPSCRRLLEGKDSTAEEACRRNGATSF